MRSAWIFLGLALGGAACTSILGDDYAIRKGTGASHEGGAGGESAGNTGGGKSGGGGEGGQSGCQDDDQCPEAEATCEEAACNKKTGECGTRPSPAKAICSDNGTMCDGEGHCVHCVDAGDCGGALECEGGICTGCALPEDCPDTGSECLTKNCVLETETCEPLPVAINGGCTMGGQVCDGAGHCVECNPGGQCVAPETCGGGGTANECGCTPSTTCGSANKTCGSVSNGCGTTLDCNDGKNGAETDVDCGGNTTACPTRCATGKTCSINTDCVTGHCAAHPAGKCGQDNNGSCTQHTDCASGHCATFPFNKCGQENGTTCTVGSECASDRCSMTETGKKCGLLDGVNCTNHKDCAAGHCSNTTSPSKCGKDTGAACSSDEECAAQNCSLDFGQVCGLDNGMDCTNSNECASGQCSQLQVFQGADVFKCGQQNNSFCNNDPSVCASQKCVGSSCGLPDNQACQNDWECRNNPNHCLTGHCD